jgi:hypothetical protein
MIKRREIGYWPFLSLGYLRPILLLFEKLLDQPKPRSSRVQVGADENTFSASIIVLSVTMLESVIRRVQASDQKTNVRSALEYLKARFSFVAPSLADELFAVRDVIVHAHVWDAKVYWNQDGDLRFVRAKRDAHFGDKKFLNIFDRKSRKTKSLRLNVFPTRICRTDAICVFSTIIELLKEIEITNINYVYITNEQVFLKGRRLSAADLPSALRKWVAG